MWRSRPAQTQERINNSKETLVQSILSYTGKDDMSSRTIRSSSESFTYTGHQMTSADGNGLAWDENGQLLTGVDPFF
jgi:hypothetical protein